MTDGGARAARIHVTGIVQGVGMRPFVYREALAHGVTGWVLNAGDGVHIEAHAPDAEALAAFTRALRDHAPAAARIERVEVASLDGAGAAPASFEIVASDGGTKRTTLVSPDIATCPDCLAELFDPADRRYHYPFINCTNCGPRFTIIRSLPYDRASTSMDAFPMCGACAAEYADPADRRFHAQPDACFECGPHLTWRESPRARDLAPSDRADVPGRPLVGSDRETSDAIVERAAALIAAGGIVAVKGLGGFHLVCDAGDERAVAELRRRKRRPAKPFAVMVADAEAAAQIGEVGAVERKVLTGSVRPIALLIRRDSDGLAPDVAPGLDEVGVMLPYTPLQHLLVAACARLGSTRLVMTSGNLSGAPIETDDGRAWERLVASGLADALLGNDRPILSRFDDSVVRVVHGAPRPVRRARGYAPAPLPLPPAPGPGSVLACGPEQKATVAIARPTADGAECLVSQHVGDLEGAEVLTAWHEARRRLEDLFDIAPAAIACDLHPRYHASAWARDEARRRGAPLVEVQHHHAHIASVLAEAAARGRIDAGARVVGLALDGTGAGTDGSVWGCEVLACDLAGYARLGSLAPWRLPGGAAAVRDPRRSALALLVARGLGDEAPTTVLPTLGAAERDAIATMVERGINSPWTSSAGRLLDAVAALLGISLEVTYEGQPACELEAAAWRAVRRKRGEDRTAALPDFGLAWRRVPEPDAATREPMARAAEQDAQERLMIDPAPALERMIGLLARGASPDVLALAFHRALARSLVEAAALAAERTGTGTIALSGGVFLNRLIFDDVARGLAARGLEVLVAERVPVNDGCISYGQAAVARARLGGASADDGTAR